MPHGNVVVGAEHISHELGAYAGARRWRTSAGWWPPLAWTDLVIVDTGDVLLVCPRDRSQEVKTAGQSSSNSAPMARLISNSKLLPAPRVCRCE